MIFLQVVSLMFPFVQGRFVVYKIRELHIIFFPPKSQSVGPSLGWRASHRESHMTGLPDTFNACQHGLSTRLSVSMAGPKDEETDRILALRDNRIRRWPVSTSASVT